MINQTSFNDEHYELFRFEVSNYLNIAIQYKNQIIKILEKESFQQKKLIKNVLLKMISDKLYTQYGYKNLDTDDEEQAGGAPKFVDINENKPSVTNYEIKNNRELCSTNKTKELCNTNIHCSWTNHGVFKIEEKNIL